MIHRRLAIVLLGTFAWSLRGAEGVTARAQSARGSPEATSLESWGPTAPRRHIVEIRGMLFHPAALEVARGDTLVWVNQDIVPHTATAKPRWDTGVLSQGKSAVIVSRRPGELRYVCTLHPTMQGRLITR